MAELALAIVPLCLAAIQAIGPVRKKLKLLRHHDREIKRLRKRFVTQTETFLDECQLLLQEVVDPKEAEEMVESVHHPQWRSAELDEQIKAYLGRKYRSYHETTEEIRSYIAALDQSLRSIVVDGRETKLKTTESIREAVDLLLNQSKYDSSVESFREANQELKRLRKTASKIRQCWRKTHDVDSRPLPPSYHVVAQHAKSFYEALRSFWSCFQAQHKGHDVRLLLESRHDNSLRVIVRYNTHTNCYTQQSLLDMWVSSQSIDLFQISMPSTRPSSSLEYQGGRPNKVRRVRFSEDCSSSTTQTLVYNDTTIVSTPPLHNAYSDVSLDMSKTHSLCSGRDLCAQLYHQVRPTAADEHPSKGGYLDAPDNLRHQLYPVCDPNECFGANSVQDLVPLKGILNMPIDSTLSVPQQMRLALKLVEGVLQFQSTPWLQPHWCLEDLSYFRIENDLTASLRTLHISRELSSPSVPRLTGYQPDALMKDVGAPSEEDIHEAQLACGIRNLTMHSLGVALLQIGRWETVDAEDIIQVRKLGNTYHDSRLGPRYQNIVQKCLDCDFGFGSDLREPELRSAIYRDVVCELEQLVRTLEGKR